MMIFPDIGLKEGRCVTHRRGQTRCPVTYSADPVNVARSFAAQGAEWLNVVDLDAKGRRARDNTEMVGAIIDAVDIPVQVGGGIQKGDHIDWWIARGAGAVVVGGAAVLDPDMVVAASRRHPFAVAIGLDIMDGRVILEGWTQPSPIDPLDVAARFDGLELAGLIVNDMDYDMALPEASLARVARIARHVTLPVYAAGLVKSLDDVARLVHLDGISGAVIGRALLANRFTVAEAQRIDRGPPPLAPHPRQPLRKSA